MSKILVAVAAMLVAVFVIQAEDAKPAAAKVPDAAAGKLQIKKDGAKVAAITIITVDGKAIAVEIDEATVKMVEGMDGKDIEAKLADADNDGLAEIKEIKAAAAKADDKAAKKAEKKAEKAEKKAEKAEKKAEKKAE